MLVKLSFTLLRSQPVNGTAGLGILTSPFCWLVGDFLPAASWREGPLALSNPAPLLGSDGSGTDVTPPVSMPVSPGVPLKTAPCPQPGNFVAEFNNTALIVRESVTSLELSQARPNCTSRAMVAATAGVAKLVPLAVVVAVLPRPAATLVVGIMIPSPGATISRADRPLARYPRELKNETFVAVPAMAFVTEPTVIIL